MAIQKSTPNVLKKRGLGFTTVINSTLDLITDPGAFAIYVYLSSKFDDWIIREGDLMRRFGKGRDWVRARVSILKKLNLIQSISHRDEKGLITGWETVLYDQPYAPIQITENPPSGKTSSVEKPTHTNTRENNTKKEKTTTTNKEESSSFHANALKQKLDKDNRTNDEFIEHVEHHVEHNSDMDKSRYQREQMILVLLARLFACGEIFRSHGYVSENEKIAKTKANQENEIKKLYHEYKQKFINDRDVLKIPGMENRTMLNFEDWLKERE